MQTTKLGLGRTEENRIDGYQLGRSRTGSYNALAAIAWGSNLQNGRIAVYSPEFNAAVAAAVDNPTRSVALPDLAGTYIRDPATGLALSTNAPLLADLKVGGVYVVAGVVTDGDRCDDSRCDRPEVWPVGDYDNLHEWSFSQNRRPVTVQQRGYARVRIGTDIDVGDLLSFADATDNADPAVGLVALGAVVVRGTVGAQALPNTWKVITGGRAGTTAEIYIDG